jgi:tRNA(Ile)-lysidine synthase
VGRHLIIRGWQPGDRVQPLGLGGRKKLQDVFVDRKVPRDERPQVPIVVDSQGRIVWVAGHVVGEPFRVTPRSEAVVVLTLRR